MSWIRRLRSKRASNKEYTRLERLLYEIRAKGVNLPECGIKAVVCRDCIAVFNLDKKGFGVTFIPTYENIDFSTNLTSEEAEEFNGGAGLVERYFNYPKQVMEKYKENEV